LICKSFNKFNTDGKKICFALNVLDKNSTCLFMCFFGFANITLEEVFTVLTEKGPLQIDSVQGSNTQLTCTWSRY